ncbi:unnamed protein product, partial [Polarella glacialis]
AEAAARKKQMELVSPRSRQESIRIVADFCEKYPAARVRPNTSELESFWARCSVLKASPLIGAIYDQLSYAGGDTSWQPRLRILYALEYLYRKGGVGKEIAVGSLIQAKGIIIHLGEVPQCAEKAKEVIHVITGRAAAQEAESGSKADSEAPAEPKSQKQPAPDLLDMSEPGPPGQSSTANELEALAGSHKFHRKFDVTTGSGFLRRAERSDCWEFECQQAVPGRWTDLDSLKAEAKKLRGKAHDLREQTGADSELQAAQPSWAARFSYLLSGPAAAPVALALAAHGLALLILSTGIHAAASRRHFKHALPSVEQYIELGSWRPHRATCHALRTGSSVRCSWSLWNFEARARPQAGMRRWRSRSLRWRSNAGPVGNSTAHLPLSMPSGPGGGGWGSLPGSGSAQFGSALGGPLGTVGGPMMQRSVPPPPISVPFAGHSNGVSNGSGGYGGGRPDIPAVWEVSPLNANAPKDPFSDFGGLGDAFAKK